MSVDNNVNASGGSRQKGKIQRSDCAAHEYMKIEAKLCINVFRYLLILDKVLTEEAKMVELE